MKMQPAKVRRDFRNPTTFETTALRFNAETGCVSRPMRAGQDVSGHAFCFHETLEVCREVWKREQDKLLAEGFEITKTEQTGGAR